jgi:hypothetical protein
MILLSSLVLLVAGVTCKDELTLCCAKSYKPPEEGSAGSSCWKPSRNRTPLWQRALCDQKGSWIRKGGSTAAGCADTPARDPVRSPSPSHQNRALERGIEFGKGAGGGCGRGAEESA